MKHPGEGDGRRWSAWRGRGTGWRKEKGLTGGARLPNSGPSLAVAVPGNGNGMEGRRVMMVDGFGEEEIWIGFASFFILVYWSDRKF